MIGLIYVFARININPGKNDAILMAGFVRSDTDTTPLGIMMMVCRKPLGVRMKMKMAGFGDGWYSRPVSCMIFKIWRNCTSCKKKKIELTGLTW